MPRVEVLTDASQLKKPPTHDDGPAGAAPARSVRRATARRASTRRARARSRRDDDALRIIDFLALHPGSTVGDLAKGLNLNPDAVSAHLAQLERAGEISRAAHGYDTNEPAQLSTRRRPTRRSH